MKTVWKQTFGKVTISIEWKIEDLWIGVFWRKTKEQVGFAEAREQLSGPYQLMPVVAYIWDVWVCILPCLPIHIRKDV